MIAQFTQDWPGESIHTMEIGKWHKLGYLFNSESQQLTCWVFFFPQLYLVNGRHPWYCKGRGERSQGVSSLFLCPPWFGISWRVMAASCWCSSLSYYIVHHLPLSFSALLCPAWNFFGLKYLNDFLFPDHILSDSHSKFI